VVTNKADDVKNLQVGLIEKDKQQHQFTGATHLLYEAFVSAG